MKFRLLLLLFLSSSFLLQAQRKSLAPVRKGEKWGLIDAKGREVAPIQYGQIGPFVNGFARAFKDGKVGFIDTNGKELFPFDLSSYSEFNKDGIAVRGEGKLLTVVNKKLETLFTIPFKPEWGCAFGDYPKTFTEGLAMMDVYPDCQSADTRGGFFNMKGELVIPFQFYVAGEGFFGTFHEGRCPFYDDQKQLWGFIDTKGKVVVPPTYSYVYNYNDGAAITFLSEKMEDSEDNIESTGIIDLNGKPLFEGYSVEFGFNERRIPIYRDEKYGYGDPRGRVVIPLEYDKADLFSEGLACVSKGELSGFIDTTGKVIIPLQFAGAGRFTDGLSVVCSAPFCWGPGQGVINKKGDLVLPMNYPGIASCSGGVIEAVPPGTKEGEHPKFLFFDVNGKPLPIKGEKYDEVGAFEYVD